MERSTSVNPGPGEQNLTPGEQRILALMEQGQRRLEQRMERMDQRIDQRLQSLENKLNEHGEQLQALTIKVEEEAAASRMRDRQLAADLQSLRQESQERDAQLLVRIDRTHHETLALLNKQVNTLRNEVSERFNQHNTRLEMLEQTVRTLSERNRETSENLHALTVEVRKLADRLDLKADA